MPKVCIRRGLFETNSSSSHSLTIKNNWKPDPNADYKSKFRFDERGAILVDLSCATPAECDSWHDSYYEKKWSTAEQKLALAIRLSANQWFNCKERYNVDRFYYPTMSELEETSPFCDVVDILKKYTGCTYVHIDNWGEDNSSSRVPVEHVVEPMMFDDDVNYLDDFLRITNISLEQFLLDDNITVENVYECY